MDASPLSASELANALKLEIPGKIALEKGKGGLPLLRLRSDSSEAEIYFNGATVTHFQKTGGRPVLHLSSSSRFEKDQAIRGGVPIIFPWFGNREGFPAHGFVRNKPWQLNSTSIDGNRVRAEFRFPIDQSIEPKFQNADVSFALTLSESLEMEFAVRNRSTQDVVTFEECLHTYFAVGDVERVELRGLKDVTYVDKTENFTRKVQQADPLTIKGEVDSVYENTQATVEINDPVWQRRILVEKEHSQSTVVWNPGSVKAAKMADLDDFRKFVCVESGNAGGNAIALKPGEGSLLRVRVRVVS